MRYTSHLVFVYFITAAGCSVAVTCFIMSDVLPRHELRPSFLLYVLVCTYLLCASHTVFSYSRAKHLTRPVDDFYGLPTCTNYTSHIDLYVYSYHLVHDDVNTSRHSNCTVADPCLTISDANSIFQEFWIDRRRTSYLLTMYLVADPVLKCRVNSGQGFSISQLWNLGTLYNGSVIFIHRAMLLPGCELASVTVGSNMELFNYFMTLGALKLQSIKIIVSNCYAQHPNWAAISLRLAPDASTQVTLQNCVFMVQSLCCWVLYMSEMEDSTVQFRMRNCTTEWLPNENRSCLHKDLLYIHKFPGNDLVVTIRDSFFLKFHYFPLSTHYMHCQ